ncbi:MAG: hypothetical protein LBB72_09510 [Spirochaetaceae bacterium]|nr:hypothetical protein [Spirochaetaceae bacterium]
MIGTSGYDYPEWKGGFYPEELSKARFLEYYSTLAIIIGGTIARKYTRIPLNVPAFYPASPTAGCF